MILCTLSRQQWVNAEGGSIPLHSVAELIGGFNTVSASATLSPYREYPRGFSQTAIIFRFHKIKIFLRQWFLK
jgi:hypothetical protein